MDSIQIAKWEKDHAEKLKEWQAEHGKLARFPTRKGMLVFRTPGQDDYERFLNKLAAQEDQAPARRELAQRSVLSHEPEALAKIFESLPAIPAQIESKLSDLAGMSDDVELLEEADGTERLVVETANGAFTFRLSTLDEWEALGRTNKKAKRGDRAKNLRGFCSLLLVSPDDKQLEELFKRRPGLPTAIVKKLSDTLGGDVEALEKKA